MPQPRVLDFTQSEQRDPSGVEELFSTIQKVYKDEADKKTIEPIWEEYLNNRKDSDNYVKTQLSLERSPLSPTKRLEAQKKLNEMEKIISEKDKTLNAKAKVMQDIKEVEDKKKALSEKTLKEQNEKDEKIRNEQASVKSLYLENDYPEEEAERLSKFDTPTIAQAKVRERNVDKRANKKTDSKIKEDENSKIVTQKAFDDLAKLIPKVGRSGVIQSKLGYGSQPYAEFSSLTGALESLLVEKVNKGALSNTRFKYITETLLPKPSDTQSEIKGKLKGLATILELDPSALLGKDEIKEKKDPHKGMVQVKDPQGVLRWVPREIADKMKGG